MNSDVKQPFKHCATLRDALTVVIGCNVQRGTIAVDSDKLSGKIALSGGKVASATIDQTGESGGAALHALAGLTNAQFTLEATEDSIAPLWRAGDSTQPTESIQSGFADDSAKPTD